MEAVEVLDALAYHQKQVAYHQAQAIRVLAEYAVVCAGDEFFDAEIAAAMHWTSRWTTDQVHLAVELASKLPQTLDALEKGEIDLYKARVLYERTLPLTADLAAEVEERVLVKAPEQTGAQMRQLTNRVVMRVDPEGHKARAEERKKQRCTGIDSLEDDMARIWAFLPAHLAAACSARVDAIAQQVKTPQDPRTLDQVRADVFADLLLATPDKASAVKVELYVTVSAATLMGLSEQPGELAGYGPITPGLARELAGDATWRRLLTDPATAEALEFGTSTYRPPAALRRFVWTRDRTCRFPGCTRPSHKSELDHTIPFPVGSTSADNLGAFCKRHHRVKHRSAWQVTQPKPGRFCFKSPAGKPTNATQNQYWATHRHSERILSIATRTRRPPTQQRGCCGGIAWVGLTLNATDRGVFRRICRPAWVVSCARHQAGGSDLIGACLTRTHLCSVRPAQPGACRPDTVQRARTAAFRMPDPHTPAHGEVFGGVDTHTDTHHAAALDHLGRLLGDAEFPATPDGCAQLPGWLTGFGPIATVGVEGTGSYGKQLAISLRQHGIQVREVSRPDRRTRRSHGKSDVIDAINAARAVISDDKTATPKTADGPIESIRALRIVRGGAVKARTAARNELTNLITTAPAALREALRGKQPKALLTACTALEPDLTQLASPTHGTMLALRSMAERIAALNQQITQLDKHLDRLVTATAPTLVGLLGIGTDVAGQLLVTAGDNPQRLHSEAAFAKLCGVAPLPASSGRTDRHRLNKGGERQANRVLHIVAVVRLRYCPRTKAYLQRRTEQGLTKRDILRCLKRYILREAHTAIMKDLAQHA